MSRTVLPVRQSHFNQTAQPCILFTFLFYMLGVFISGEQPSPYCCNRNVVVVLVVVVVVVVVVDRDLVYGEIDQKEATMMVHFQLEGLVDEVIIMMGQSFGVVVLVVEVNAIVLLGMKSTDDEVPGGDDTVNELVLRRTVVDHHNHQVVGGVVAAEPVREYGRCAIVSAPRVVMSCPVHRCAPVC